MGYETESESEHESVSSNKFISNFFFNAFNWKIMIYVFLIYIIIDSDEFTDLILSSFNGAVVDGDITTYGSILRGSFVIAGYAIIDPLVKYSYI